MEFWCDPYGCSCVCLFSYLHRWKLWPLALLSQHFSKRQSEITGLHRLLLPVKGKVSALVKLGVSSGVGRQLKLLLSFHWQQGKHRGFSFLMLMHSLNIHHGASPNCLQFNLKQCVTIDCNKQIGGMMRNGTTEATVIKSLHGSKWLPSLDLWAEWSIKNKAVWNAAFQHIWKHCGNTDSLIQILTLWRVIISVLNFIKQNALKYLSALVLLYCKVNVLVLESKMVTKHPFGSECPFCYSST